MKETIYLVVSRHRVERMTKRMPELSRGEIPVKLVLEVDPSAFREPVIEKQVIIEDWRQGIDIGDVELREGVITETEAQMIRERRLAEMKRILEEQGYKIEEPVSPESEA